LKIKVDENLGRNAVELLRLDGHEVMTVRDQGLGGAPDETIFAVCAAERRVLITLDRDFGQVRRFPPNVSAGVVIIELGGPASLALIEARLRDFLLSARHRPVEGELWIVEPGRIRVHLEPGA
jgi:uncharacterized protein with PIN domain